MAFPRPHKRLPEPAEDVAGAFGQLADACRDYLAVHGVDRGDHPASRAECAFLALVVEETARRARELLRDRPSNPLDE